MMSLETEFRLHQQLLRLERHWGDCLFCDRNLATTHPAAYPVSHRAFQSHPLTGLWVKLRQVPDPLTGDEALLLCQVERDWIVWLPNWGEMVLRSDEFDLP